METTGDRIRYIREGLGLKQEQFAKKLKVTRGAVTNWERDGGITLSNIKAISKLSGVSVDWITDAKGPIPEFGDISHADQLIDTIATISEHGGVKGIPEGATPEIDVTAGLGGGGLTTEVVPGGGLEWSAEIIRDWWRIPNWFSLALGVRPGRLAILPSQGDSMAPTIINGDVVLIDTGHRVPSPPGIYALADEFGGIVIKRLEVVSGPKDESLTVRVSSDNPHHGNYTRTMDEIRIVGRYLARLTRS